MPNEGYIIKIDDRMTNNSIKYLDPKFIFQALIPSQETEDEVVRFEKEDQLKLDPELGYKGWKGQASQISISGSEKKTVLEPWMLEYALSAVKMKNMSTTRRLMYIERLNVAIMKHYQYALEMAIKNEIETNGRSEALAGDKWDTGTAKIDFDIETLKEAMKDDPTHLFISQDVWKWIISNEKLISRLSTNKIGILTPSDIKSYFNVPNIVVLNGKSKPGLSNLYWDNTVIMTKLAGLGSNSEKPEFVNSALGSYYMSPYDMNKSTLQNGGRYWFRKENDSFDGFGGSQTVRFEGIVNAAIIDDDNLVRLTGVLTP